MQALSFAVHIPLVCFGVAFPVFVLAMEWLGRRRGDPLLIALAKRWSKAMIALFAIGVVTGTILSFELGLLWPEFMATYGDVFGLAFALEGFSFFVEAIFIAIYVYGWDRLSPRAHMLRGHPGGDRRLHRVAVRAHRQRLDEPPGGLPAGERRAPSTSSRSGAVRQLLLLARDGAHVPGGVPRRRLRRRRASTRPPGCAGGATATCAWRWRCRWWSRRSRRRRRSSSATGRRARSPTNQPTKLAAFEGWGRPSAARRSTSAAGTTRSDGEVEYGIADPQAAVAARLPRPERDGARARHRAAPRTARRSTSCASRSRRWSASAR